MTYNQFLKYELGFSDEQIAEMNEQLKEETVGRTTTTFGAYYGKVPHT